MNINEVNGSRQISENPELRVEQPSTETPRPKPPEPPENETIEDHVESQENQDTPKQDEPDTKPALDRKKMIMLGGGLLAAVLFFVITAVIGRSPSKGAESPRVSSQDRQKDMNKPKGSLAPLMDTVRKPDAGDVDGQLTPNDIKRMRSEVGANPFSTVDRSQSQPPVKPVVNASLGSVPSFADTQQKWEEPRPYGESAQPSAAQTQQQQNALKETSLVFVRSETKSQAGSSKLNSNDDDAPLLEVSPGSRILAKLQEQVSSADPTPVVAVVEYTYALGDQVVIPAGATITGHMQQVDRYGDVGVKFDEVDYGGRTEKIEAVGKGLDLGPIKGVVTGKDTGKSLLVRSISGIGSTLAMVLGTNTSSAFSEDDLIRERLAENIGTAGDSEIMNMAANSKIVVSVPADTKIYVVFTKHEATQPTLHKVTTLNP
ncbi:TrbI/VirB10 family protein [Acidicapsa ligni]|uniref:TrbI/VirB10 family protein n=1 Tax=Acidicapsa ligni TaxID=542300 RepID=UPI0021E083AC|nr:TrbI/VirB10 family protein [Acidicapsa ligni]